jgi:hypothetical protein
MCQPCLAAVAWETHSDSEMVTSWPISVSGSVLISNVAPLKLIVQVPELGDPHDEVIVNTI